MRHGPLSGLPGRGCSRCSCGLRCSCFRHFPVPRGRLDSGPKHGHNVMLADMAEANPFLDALRFERRAPPCAIVIFGANGDLTKRKLMPALYRLAYERRIPPTFAVIGNSRTVMDDDQFRGKMRESVAHFLEDSPFEADLWESFAK